MTRFGVRVVGGQRCEHADPSHTRGLLRAHRERPHDRTSEQRDELAALHEASHVQRLKPTTSSAHEYFVVHDSEIDWRMTGLGQRQKKNLAVFELQTRP